MNSIKRNLQFCDFDYRIIFISIIIGAIYPLLSLLIPTSVIAIIMVGIILTTIYVVSLTAYFGNKVCGIFPRKRIISNLLLFTIIYIVLSIIFYN